MTRPLYGLPVLSALHTDGAQVALSVALGVGLATAVGLRVFLPLLILSIAAHTGHVSLTAGFGWLAGDPALVMLSVAALLEVLAYYLPGVDNLLDVLAAPSALVAGSVVAAAVMTDLPPMVRWTTAIIAGGGAAGFTHGVTSLLRAKSTLVTAGLGNPVIATFEWCGAVLLTLLALFVPFVALVVIVLSMLLAVRLLRRALRKRQQPASLPVVRP
jgi:Domain of unknown function (DUF4126)